MEKSKRQFLSLHPAGQLLGLLILVLPALRVFLYPNDPGSWQFFAFNINVSFAEVLFITLFILGRRKRGYRLDHTSGLLWVSFLIWAGVALTNISSAPTSAIITMQFFIHFFFAVTLGSYLRQDPPAAGVLIKATILSLILFLPVFLAKLSIEAQILNFDWSWSLPGFSNVRHLDYFLGASLGLIGFLPTLYKREAKKNTLWFLLTLACWILVFWSGGRGSALAAMGALGIGFIIIRPDGWQKIALLNLATLLFGAAISLLLPQPNGSYGLFRFLSKITETTDLNGFSAGRVDIWLGTIDVWLDHFWTGVGAGQTKALVKSANGIMAQPHCVFLQALMAWGVVGGLPFLGVIGKSLWTAGRQVKNNFVGLCGFVMALTTAINAFVDGTLYYPFPLWLFIIGLMIALTPQRQEA